ncbi:LysE family translocator [Pararhodobacter oceanensis]|uniref:Amino acid transporter n=1 Tax=Pararhodobacter oceanensis TaxID=2172121 RepID=A0A2T8HXL5_9RHOB|nr:LysE family translocator [Pararhodobacter oceanensis]PVH30158.1 amino acid transporter [Pararhodobacter oceanensis]
MPSIDVLIAFFMATAVFAYMPGPSTLYAAAQTLARGRRAGWAAALGIHLGGYLHVFAAALGLAVVFKAVPVLFVALKFGGAAYLIYLGYKMFTARASLDFADLRVSAKTPRKAFWESVTVEMLNPKTAIFYLAFLPQFTDPAASAGIWLQLLVLGTVVNLMFSSADVICVVLADRIASYFKRSGTGGGAGCGIAQRLGGGILVALGVRLALSQP